MYVCMYVCIYRDCHEYVCLCMYVYTNCIVYRPTDDALVESGQSEDSRRVEEDGVDSRTGLSEMQQR